MLTTNWVAHHVGVSHKKEKEAFLEAHVKASYYCWGTKLFSESFDVVYFISNSILAFEHKQHFQAFVKLFTYEIMLIEEPCLQVSHDRCHESWVSIVIFKSHERKRYWSTPFTVISLRYDMILHLHFNILFLSLNIG